MIYQSPGASGAASWSRVLKIVLTVYMAACAGQSFATESAPVDLTAPHFQALKALEPAEQQRQLGLMLLVTAGVDEEMLDVLEAQAGQASGTEFLKPGDYTAPLARIVNQETLLEGATRLFRFVDENESAIRDQIAVLDTALDSSVESIQPPEPGNPSVTAVPDDDAVLIRQAIADSMVAVGGQSLAEQAVRYRSHTVVLRNALEYAQFQADLDRITDQAIASVGGKLDAYQRMFDSETNSGNFDERIRSAELIYLPEGEFDPRAGELTDEILESMMLLESSPNR